MAKDEVGQAPRGGSVPVKLSPSRAKDFMSCPRKFYYKSVLRLPCPPSRAATVGTVAHSAFETIFELPRGERSVEAGLAFVLSAWEILVDPLKAREDVEVGSPEDLVRRRGKAYRDLVAEESTKEKQLLESAAAYRELCPRSEDVFSLLETVAEMVVNWFSMESPDKFDPEGRELYLGAEVLGVPLHGFIDRLDKVERAGEVSWFITDYKTGKVPGERYMAENFFAMKVYAALYRAIHKIQVEQLRLVYVKQPGRSSVKTLKVTPAMLEETEKELERVWAQIQDFGARGDWPTRVGKLCPWCDFQGICPAFNKQELEGIGGGIRSENSAVSVD